MVFYHTFAMCQKLGQLCFVFELVLGVVPTAIGYNLKHVMTEYITKYHIDGCGRSMPRVKRHLANPGALHATQGAENDEVYFSSFTFTHTQRYKLQQLA